MKNSMVYIPTICHNYFLRCYPVDSSTFLPTIIYVHLSCNYNPQPVSHHMLYSPWGLPPKSILQHFRRPAANYRLTRGPATIHGSPQQTPQTIDTLGTLPKRSFVGVPKPSNIFQTTGSAAPFFRFSSWHLSTNLFLALATPYRVLLLLKCVYLTLCALAMFWRNTSSEAIVCFLARYLLEPYHSV